MKYGREVLHRKTKNKQKNMKLAISNICWNRKYDEAMYQFLRDHEYALEAVPDRIFEWQESKISDRMISPYEKYDDARIWYRIVNSQYRISIASMHLILQNEDVNMFASATYRRYLMNVLKNAVRFADQIKCPNLCFDCVKNRRIPDGMHPAYVERTAVAFFREIADYAGQYNITISIEPLPGSLDVNFITGTFQAFAMARRVNRNNFAVNINTGTIFENNENIQQIFCQENMQLIKHIHLAEPGFEAFRPRKEYIEIAGLLNKCGYEGYVSACMTEHDNAIQLQGAMNYFNKIFNKE